MENFENSYKQLTERQKEAVDYTEGPLLVIAGPGTGKTQLLSMRVANILRKTDASPSNILCLTFTNKAASNMHNRLQQLIGSESLGVNIKTFHSLSAEIMGEYPEYFWNGASLTTAPDAVQTEIIESILKELPLDNPLAMRFAGNLTSIKRVQEALKLSKEAGLTPDKLEAILNYNIEYINSIEDELLYLLPDRLSYKGLEKLYVDISSLTKQHIDDTIKPLISLSTYITESLRDAIDKDTGTNKTKHVGLWRNKLVQTEAGVKGMHRQKKSNQWWLNIADVYRKYRDQLHKRGYYDYSDMIIEVISQLESNPALLSSIQERYLYIMIDEFQDSNAAQMRLAHLIASHPVDDDNPNLMVVGDDDQSIFKFNGAELSNMLRFRESYPSAKVIVLEDNFRSSQAVLDTSKSVIELAEDRLINRDDSITKNLVAKNEPKEKSFILHRSYLSREQQLFETAKEISEKFTKTDQSIAVLARKHDSLEIIASILNSLNTPVHYERQNNILENEVISQVISICRIIKTIMDGDTPLLNSSIVEVLTHKMWRIDTRKLWELAIENRHSQNWLASMLDHQDKLISDIGKWFFELVRIAANNRIEIILDYILGLRKINDFESPIRKFYILNTDSNISYTYLESLSAIQKLRSAVSEVSRENITNINGFLDFINIHIENGIAITDESSFITSERAVNLLTVHKAKGLEFDRVYIIECVEKQWQPRPNRTSAPLNLPLKPYGEDMDDYIRLMYVAMTRAKKDIIATSYRQNESSEEVVATQLIASSLERNEIDELKDKSKAIEVLENNVIWPTLNSSDAKLLLKNTLENYSLNVTALMNFLDITRGGPAYFLERNLLRLPSSRTTSLAFGTAIHSSLELAQRQINLGDFDIESIKQHYEKEISNEQILEEEIARWKPYGIELLTKLFDQHILTLPEGGIPEQRLVDIDIDGALLDGKLDHIIIDKETSSALITDYKTGAPLKSFTSNDKSLQIKLWKHKTQLIFYALLAKNHHLFKEYDIFCRMQYVQASNVTEINREYAPSQDEINRLAELSRQVYKKIVNYDLPDTSNYSSDINGILRFEEDLINNRI